MYEPSRMSNRSRRKVEESYPVYGIEFLSNLIDSRELPSMEDVSSSLV